MLSLYYRMSASKYLWWEVFGSFAEPRALGSLPARSTRRRVMQERFSPAQRRARKRRAFVHGLNAQC